MTIKRGGIAEPINTNLHTKAIPQYCPVCERHKVRHTLNKRVYNDLELVYDQLPSDHDRWLQCYHCGNVFMKDRVRQEGRLTSQIEIPKSGSRQSEHWEKPKHRRGFNERIERDDDIKDPEVKKALKRGAKLLSYSER